MFIRAIATIVIGLLSLCAFTAAFLYVDDYWEAYSIFSETFTMPFFDVSHFSGGYTNEKVYAGWVSFIYDGSPVLRHPENYHDVPCTIRSVALPLDNPFIPANQNFKKALQIILPHLQCKYGIIPGGIGSKREEYNLHSRLIYNLQTHQAFFTVEE